MIYEGRIIIIASDFSEKDELLQLSESTPYATLSTPLNLIIPNDYTRIKDKEPEPSTSAKFESS